MCAGIKKSTSVWCQGASLGRREKEEAQGNLEAGMGFSEVLCALGDAERHSALTFRLPGLRALMQGLIEIASSGLTNPLSSRDGDWEFCRELSFTVSERLLELI